MNKIMFQWLVPAMNIETTNYYDFCKKKKKLETVTVQ